MLFPVHDLLEVYGREAAAGEEGEECVSLGGRLTEALVCDDGCRGTCEVSYSHNLLIGCVCSCLLVEEDVLQKGFIAISLIGHVGGGGRGCLDVHDLVCL